MAGKLLFLSKYRQKGEADQGALLAVKAGPRPDIVPRKFGGILLSERRESGRGAGKTGVDILQRSVKNRLRTQETYRVTHHLPAVLHAPHIGFREIDVVRHCVCGHCSATDSHSLILNSRAQVLLDLFTELKPEHGPI